MQDIDFDELDRAVSSALGGKTPAAQPSAPRVDEPDTVPVVQSTLRPAQASPAARRSNGRFMDVVHPSSDMRTTTPPRPAPAADVSRPVVNTPPPAAPTPAPVAVTPAPTPDLPDPLDFGLLEQNSSTDSTNPLAPVPPIESPFLANTKVEKRPLGGFARDEDEEEVASLTATTIDQALLEAPDIDLIEAEAEVPVKPEAKQTITVSEPAVAAPDESQAGPTSIRQQYIEKPRPIDQPTGAIYDTEAYHQPLTHTAKNRSSLLILAWIVGLILVGAGAGAAVYFFVLPAL